MNLNLRAEGVNPFCHLDQVGFQPGELRSNLADLFRSHHRHLPKSAEPLFVLLSMTQRQAADRHAKNCNQHANLMHSGVEVSW